jgi:integrase
MDPVTVHDLRRTAATLLTEHGFDKDVIEKALSHERQGIRGVYILAEYAEQRKRMLQWWADYVNGVVNESRYWWATSESPSYRALDRLG